MKIRPLFAYEMANIISKSFTIEGTPVTVEVMEFNLKDRPLFKQIYTYWRNLCDIIEPLKSRNINLPEGLSEGAFCLEMGCYRKIGNISSINSSFDCIKSDGTRLQVKACSIIPDLTSFGPKSVWDELYFCDFFRRGDWDGSFDIYLIPNELIFNHKVNATETFRDHQRQGRRPRFSVFNGIIKMHNITPIKTGKL